MWSCGDSTRQGSVYQADAEEVLQPAIKDAKAINSDALRNN
jgi:hypothetical protein